MNKQRKTSHILNVFQYDDITGAVILPSTLVLTAPANSDNSTKVPTTSWVRTYVTGLSYLTGNQSITVSGDATGSGTTSIALTLANSGVTAGTYGSTTLVPVITVDSKGRITSVTTAAISGSLTFTGDVTGTGTTGTSTGLTLAASGVTAGTYTKVTVDSKGRVTVGASATTSDIGEGTNLYYTEARVNANANVAANTAARHNAVTIGTANGLSLSTQVLSLALASTSATGALSSTDWNTFNGKQAALSGTGFVKSTGGTISYDTNTYLTTTAASATYPTLTGGNASGSWGIDITGFANQVSGTTAAGSEKNLLYQGIADNDIFRLRVGGASNAGWVELATADDGTEPIYVRQYTGPFITVARTATLLDGSGNTSFPGTVTAPTFSGALSGNATSATSAGSISGFNNPATAATANTIVYRDSAGDIYGRYLFGSYQNSSDDVNTGNISYIMAKFGDNYHRSATAARVQAFLGLGSAAYQNTGAFLSSSGNLTVTGAGSSSSIYMSDTDEGQREIHCNSNRIGFLTQAGAWGAWCDDAGNWNAANFSGSSSGTNTGDQTNISGNAATATNVAWGGITSKPGWMQSASLIESHSNANEWRNSGFYENGGGGSNWPSQTWYNSVNVRHSNQGNYHGFQVAMSYYDNLLWFRSYQGSGTFQSWAYAISNQNIGSQSVNYANSAGSASSASTATTADNLSGFDKTNPSFGAVYASNWFRSYGDSGLYNQDYGCHFRRNTTSSHGSWEMFGYNKGGYNGLLLIDPQGYWNNLMYENGNGGVYSQNANGWQYYYHRGNNCFAMTTGTTSGSYRAYVGGSLYAEGDIVAYSDARLKTDVITIDNPIDKVTQMRGVYYTKIGEEAKGRQTGVIAQEINEVLPEVVTYASDIDTYGVSYGNIVGVLIEAIKEQQTQIEDLKNKLDLLTQK